MKLQIFLILSTLLFTSLACTDNKTTDNGKENNSTTITGGCYHTALEGWEELLNIVVDGKTVTGTGRRLHLKFNEKFNLIVNGKIRNDGSYEVSINAQSTLEGREGVSETNFASPFPEPISGASKI